MLAGRGIVDRVSAPGRRASALQFTFAAGRLRLSLEDHAMFATLTSKGQITLPMEIRERLGLDAGSMLA
jgi:hypothetical protein